MEPDAKDISGARSLSDLAALLAKRERTVHLRGLRGAARAVTVAHLVQAHGDRPVLVIVPTAKQGDAFLEDLRAALGEAPEEGRLRAFPRYDTQPYERFSPQPFLVAQRMDVLHRWLTAAKPASARNGNGAEPAPIVVAPWTALAPRVPTRAFVRGRSVPLQVGQNLDRDALVETLVAAGYARMPIVEERGEIAVRGGILDLFPPHRRTPVRIELLGDEIESIRDFDPASQRSQAPLSYVVAPPPREIPLDRDHVIECSDAIRERAAQQGVPGKTVDGMIDMMLRGSLPPGAEAIAPLLMQGTETVLDFLPDDTLIVVDDPAAGRERLLRYAEEMFANHELAREAGRLVLPPADLTTGPEELERAVDARAPILIDHLDIVERDGATRHAVHAPDQEELRRALQKARTGDRALAPLAEAITRWKAQRQRIVLAAPSLSHAERLRTLLLDYGVDARATNDPRPVWRWSGPGRVEIRAMPLSAGFRLPAERLVVVTEEEIFGPREKTRRKSSAWPSGAAVETLSQLSPGDALVHAEHGIGIYRGLVELELRGVAGEFLRLEYAEQARLFVPVHRLSLVQRYAGSDGHVPRIDKLGGATWEKAKGSIKKSLREMAKELLSVHAAREIATGFSFSPRDRLFEQFEATFAFDETPDQLAAIEDALADMERDKPMDRIVCGDVGYGKTEVAIRAAFRAAMDGKQVAVLVPTTILCQQHEETFRTRFEGYPVRIEALSRFQAPRQSRAVLEGLASGEIDVLIGTHRVLQKSVVWRDLGLLIVDEEHRFGVADKERIKQLKKTVDVLTLTATPIPRTLQLAFTGMRDLSVIDTPPADRLAIRTQVCRFSEEIIREAILREMRRGGQVYFVHNRVQTIAAMADTLAKIVPEAKIVVAHGQMRERDLEEKTLAFMHGKFDVLLCTTIIESGVDNPRANTILVNRADALGLAQLYQLRGRVGRSTHRAYAYLMVHSPDRLTVDARKRLEAIQDLSELGSGFRLANMDLEIRGAGNLLGAEQSGNLAAVGYDTYMEMLEETIDDLRGMPHVAEVDPEIRLPVPARLPDDYVAAVNQRLVLYKRLSSCRDDAEVDRIRDELLDRFGPLPGVAQNLLHVIRLKIVARRLGVASIDLANGEFVLRAADNTNVDPERLLRLMTQARGGLRVTPGHKIFAPAPRNTDAATLFDAARRLLAHLGA